MKIGSHLLSSNPFVRLLDLNTAFIHARQWQRPTFAKHWPIDLIFVYCARFTFAVIVLSYAILPALIVIIAIFNFELVDIVAIVVVCDGLFSRS